MTPDDYDRLYAESRDRPAFANGTEGYGWVAANCDRCVHDKPARQGDEANGCPLVLITLLGRTPAQFLDGPRDENGLYGIADQYHCIEFRSEDDGPGPEPRPIPTPPGQLELLPRAPYEGHRMLTPLENAACTTDEDFAASQAAGFNEDLDAFTARLDAKSATYGET